MSEDWLGMGLVTPSFGGGLGCWMLWEVGQREESSVAAESWVGG